MQTTDLRGARLSLQQQRLWSFLQDNPVYRIQGAFLLNGQIDYTVFQQALHQVSEQHEILRTVFQCLKGMEIPVQVIGYPTELACTVIGLENVETLEQQTRLDEYYAHLQEQPFDLAHGPIITTILFRLSPEKHQLFICIPSLCIDAFTLPLLVAELIRSYDACLQHTWLDLDPLQYTAVSTWQHELLEAEDAKAPLEYWRRIDLTCMAQIQLPFLSMSHSDSYAVQALSFKPQIFPMNIDTRLVSRLIQLTHSLHVPLARLLFTAWQAVLRRLTGDDKLIVGLVCNGREDEELESALGPYSHSVPIELLFDEQWTFADAAFAVHQSLDTASRWQTYFVWPSESKSKEGETPNTYFPIVFEYAHWPASIQGQTLSLSLSRRSDWTEPFVIKLHVLQMGDHLALELQYDRTRLHHSAVERLSKSLLALLAAALDHPQERIRDLAIMDAEQRKQLLERFCAPQRSLPAADFHQLFEMQVQRFPHQLALLSEDGCLTYQYVNQRANQLARVLRRYGAGPNRLVGLCLQRSSWMIISILAIFKAGGAYVPCDPETPAARLLYQIRDMQVPLLLTQKASLPTLQERPSEILYLETLWQAMEQEEADDLNLPTGSQDLAYVIYTSGSTGLPKGVMISQRNIVHYTTAICELLRSEPGWQYATVSTLAADLGNTAIFCALASGGCLHILNYATFTSSSAFSRWNRQNPIDVLKIVPSHLSALLSSEEAAGLLPQRALILGGEVLNTHLVARIMKMGASCAIYNHYGPTEATIGVLVNRLDDLALYDAHEGASIPLGRPLTNTEVYVLDPCTRVVPVGVTGELFIGGLGLSAGYLQRPEQTAERFIPHPFSEEEGARLYRTGDQARYTAHGQIEFMGRRDNQVKLRGYRIELGEIETVLRRHPNIWECVMVLRKDGAEDPRIIGYIVPKDQPPPTEEELHTLLCTYLPEYMLPSAFVFLKDLPLTVNGKVDRQRLPRPEPPKEVGKAVWVAPRSPIEEILLDIWKVLLSLSSLDIHENFFKLGGHSLLATQVISRVQAILHIEISLASLFEAPTIAGLAQRIEGVLQGEEKIEYPPLHPAERIQDLPLSFAQQRLWFLDRLEPESTAYLVRNRRRLDGKLDTYALDRALEALIQRHESLRTLFKERASGAVQVISPLASLSFPIVDLQGLAKEELVSVAYRLTEQEGQQPCNLARGPLFRVTLLRIGSEEHILLWTLHHIISDAWSGEIFVRELTTLYRAFSNKQSSPLSPLPIQYADFAVWQRQWLRGETLEKQLAYWRHQLAGILPLDLPTDYVRPPKKTYQGAYLSRQLPIVLQEKLVALSQQEGVTLFMALLAAFQVLLMRYTGQHDISVGTPIANRTRSEVEGLIGFFVNTLVLRTDLSGNPSFIELLKRVHEVALGAYAHQDVPFEYLVDMLQPERDLSHSPLFQVMFTLQQATGATVIDTEPQPEKVALGALKPEHRTTKFDLTFSVISSTQSLHCGAEYNTDLFASDTINCLLEHWQILLEGIVTRPQTALSELTLLSNTELHRLLVSWNPTSYEEADALCLHTLFEQQAVCRPDAIALVCGEEALTYEHLNARANQLAHVLHQVGIDTEVRVGLALERSPLFIIGILSVLKAGGSYVPLDPSYPAERLAFMLTDSQMLVLLTQHSLAETIPAQGVRIICLDSDWPMIARESQQNPLNPANTEQIAYVIYTSGSTGLPKGVMVKHASVYHLFVATQPWYHFNENDIWTLFHSYAFDFSTWEIWGALLYGGRLLVVPYEVSRTPELFHELLHTQNVTVLNQTPSAFRQLIPLLVSTENLKYLALRFIIFGGEALDLQSLWPWFQLHREQEPQLVNMYGITETTVHVTYRPLYAQDIRDAAGSVIGIPIPSLQIYVLDEYLRPVPIGVPGQVFVSGSGLSRGYLNHPDITAEHFLPHPFSSQMGMRLYKTGDLARFLRNGELEYLGRVDQQVKIRGFRIELGEIEEALGQHPEVRECVVLAREDNGDKRLVAYVIARKNISPGSDELRRFLSGKVPNYMVPAAFVALVEFPLTANGKLDRQALPLPTATRPDLDEPFVLPRTATEEVLAGIWSSVLGIEQVGIQDNFFALGGDSILSIQVLSQARERDINFSLQQLFQHQTIYELVQVVDVAANAFQPLEQTLPFSLISLHDHQKLPADVEDAYPLTALQAGMFFHSQYNPEAAVYHDITSYHLQIPFNHWLLYRVIQSLVTCHSTMRTAFDLSSFSEPLQLVYRTVDLPLQIVDLREFSATEQDKILAGWLEEDKSNLFDWTHAPLLRFQIHLRDAQSFQFTLSFHHAVLDGWSVASLFTELFKTYISLLRGDTHPFPLPPVLQYRHFVALEQRLIALEEAKHYWVEKLRDSTSILLPRWATSERVAADSSQVYVLPISISQENSTNLKKLALKLAVPVKSVLLAAHLRVLSFLYGQTDILTGLVTNGRPESSDGERILGLFLNTLPLRMRLSGGRWVDLIRETFAAECELLPYRWYPLANIQRLQGKHELFEVIFNFIHFHVYEDLLETPGYIDDFQVLGRTGFEKTNFTLAANFSLDLVSSRVCLSLRCNTTELSIKQIEAIGSYYANTLASIANEPDRYYQLQSPLSAIECQQLLIGWNATDVEYSKEKCIHELFAEQVERTPEAIALVFEDAQLTYAELKGRANQLAWHLRTLGVGPEVLVGIYMDRSLEMLVSMLGVLTAGGAYVPLDPAYPPERLGFMIEDSQIAVLVTQSWLINELPPHSAHIVCPSTHTVEHSEVDQWTYNLANTTLPEHLAYVIYTSGSTGKPKGTAISHRAVSNFFNSMQHIPEIITQDVILAITSLSFDIAILELLLPLTQGARVQIISREVTADGTELVRSLATSNATIMQATPTTWRMLLNEGWQGSKHLKMLCGGEALPLELARQLQPRGASLWNMYGPTETTVWSALARVSNEAERIVIGRAIDNTQLYVLDTFLQLAPINVIGELYIAGDGIARGYLHRPDVSAEKFLPNPFANHPGARMYRTGDLARWLPDGTLECLGRVDRQEKVRGFRIELVEVEIALGQHAAINACVVVTREGLPGDKELVAYLVAEQQPAPSPSELRSYLQEKLPSYMIPSHFVMLEALPLTPNGKIDHRSLPFPEQLMDEAQPSEVVALAPTPIEEMLADIWCMVLGRRQIKRYDDFFVLGGHSLLATQLVSRVRTMIGVELPLRTLFEAPTIAGLAQRIEVLLHAESTLAPPPLLPVKRGQALPLSFAQQRLWFLDQLEPDSVAYIMPASVQLQGKMHIEALERTMQAVVERHESLRTTFQIGTDGQPVQVIHMATLQPLRLVDLSGLMPPQREQQAHRLLKEEAQCPFNLAQGPLLRLRLLRLDVQEHLLMLSMHHIISDAWSRSVLVHELSVLYQAFVQGKPSPLSPLPIQYADYAVWQREWLRDHVLEQHIHYWQAQLSGLTPLELPTDHPRPAVQTLQGAQLNCLLPLELSQRLQAFAWQQGVTLFMLLLATFQMLLANYSGQDDIVVGTPIANRTQQEIEELIGFFVNTLVLRTDLSGGPSFLDLLQRVRETCLGAYAHQDLPFEKLVEIAQPERDLSRTPIFQVLFLLQNAPRVQDSLLGLQEEDRFSTSQEVAAKFDLALIVTNLAQGLYCTIEYDKALFEQETIRRLLVHWEYLLENVMQHAQGCINQLPFQTPNEYEHLVVHCNATQVAFSEEHRLHKVFEEQARAHPEAIALVFKGHYLSYGALDRRANQLGRWLQRHGVGPDQLVGLYLDRSLELVIGLLGILKAGGAYLPLDPAYPAQRLAFMLSEAGSCIVLTQHHLLASSSLPLPSVLALDSDWFQVTLEDTSTPESYLQPEHLAYVIYTSGSTGRPKGVGVTHRAITNRMRWNQQSFPLNDRDRFLQIASINFDIALWELLGPLMAGAQVVLTPPTIGQEGVALVSILVEHQITVAHFVPALLRVLLDEPALNQVSHLRYVFCGGEAWWPQLAQRFMQRQQAALVQFYGPTEAAISMTAWTCPSEQVPTIAPLGRPIANTQIYLLDSHGRPIPVGIPGELYIGGVCLARGYMGQPDLTAERFVPHPFVGTGLASAQPGARLYRTGDRARYLVDGQVEYLGRLDQQVKVRGVRIEPGELETLLSEHETVAACVVGMHEDKQKEHLLAAHIVLKQGKKCSGQMLRQWLRDYVPEAMIPSQFIFLETFPLTPSGKVDRRALPLEEQQEEKKTQTPHTPLEELLEQVWRDVLGRDQIGIHEDFFELGGHSLLATRVMSRVQQLYGVEISLRSLFESPTIATLAVQIEQKLRGIGEQSMPPLVPLERNGPLPLSFAQRRLWFIDQLEPDSTAYLIVAIRRIPGVLNAAALEHSLQEMVQRHESLRTTFHTVADQPVQVIHASSTLRLPCIDLQGLKPVELINATRQLAKQEAAQSYNLATGPLLRTWQIRLNPQDHVLLVTMHHIISDGWSNEIFMYEWTTLYYAFIHNQGSPLPPLPIQYADFAVWQQQWLQGAVLETLLDYWTRQLGNVSQIQLPVDHPRPNRQSHTGAIYSFALSSELSQALMSLSHQEGVTLFMTLLAAFQVLLYRYIRQEDIIVGTDSANRNWTETETLIGFFVNLLALRTNLSGQPSFREVLARVREVVLDAYTHREMPFDLLVEKLAPAQRLDRMPLVQVLFVMQNLPSLESTVVQAAQATVDTDLPDGNVPSAENETSVPIPPLNIDTTGTAKFDLALFMEERDGQLYGMFNYSLDLFEANTIMTMAARFQTLLQSIIGQPDRVIDSLAFFTTTELTQQSHEEQKMRNELRMLGSARITGSELEINDGDKDINL